jgi:hypothetical protein
MSRVALTAICSLEIGYAPALSKGAAHDHINAPRNARIGANGFDAVWLAAAACAAADPPANEPAASAGDARSR